MYKVEIRKGLFGHADWKNFSKVIFEISLDNKRYKGEAFYSILSWAKKRFESIDIIVCDTLWRHNLSFTENISTEEAYKRARSIGDAWINDVSPYFSELQITPHITRWDDWLHYDKTVYARYVAELEDTYNSGGDITKDIDKTCDSVWVRKQQKEGLSSSLEHRFKEEVVKPYLFEETALSAVFLPALNGVSAYPGSLPNFWNLFIKGELKILQGFRNQVFISLDLKRHH